MNKKRIALYVDVVMIVLALITIFLLFYEMTIAPEKITPETIEQIRSKVILIHRLDFWICMIFIAEFSVRTWKEENKRQYLRMHWLEIPGMIPFTVFNISKTFRILRLFRLVRVFSLTKRFSRLFQKRFIKNELQYTALIVLVILVFSSYGIFFSERLVNPDINNVGDAVWWSVVTITTVGYGDKVPLTPLGKVIGVILMFTGIGIIGVLSGTIASRVLHGYSGTTEDVAEALRILKLRRAKGEVTEEQYTEIKKDLEEMLKT